MGAQRISVLFLVLGLLLILTGIYANSITDDLFEYSFVLAAICLLNILNLTTSLFGKSNKLDVVLNLAILTPIKVDFLCLRNHLQNSDLENHQLKY